MCDLTVHFCIAFYLLCCVMAHISEERLGGLNGASVLVRRHFVCCSIRSLAACSHFSKKKTLTFLSVTDVRIEGYFNNMLAFM
jgi:hypothetical protein